MCRDLAAAREAQQAAKVAAQAEMATIEASEFHRVLDEHRTIELKNIAQVSEGKFFRGSSFTQARGTCCGYDRVWVWVWVGVGVWEARLEVELVVE